MRNVLVSDKLSEAGLDALRRHKGLAVDYAPGIDEDALAKRIADAEALVVRSGSKVTAKVIANASRLRVIGRAGIGVDNVDVVAATKRGIVVMNTPTGNAVTTAEHALSLLMSLARKIPQATQSMRLGKWEKSKFQGRELAGKTLGIIGLGNIGRIVADRAKGLKMHVLGFDPVMTADRAASLGIELASLDAIFAKADAITVHTPLNAQTKGVVNDAAIAKMKTGILLVNCARGGIYDEAALLRGLESGKLGGVALDVFDEEPPPKTHPLLGRDDVVLTPHLGASTEEAQERVALEIAEQVAAFLMQGTITNAVNAPSVGEEALPRLRPWLALARKLARFAAYVGDVAPRSIVVETAGDPAHLGATSLTRTAVAELLARFIDEPVNEVSALHHAQDRGVEIKESRLEHGTKYAHELVFRVTGKDERAVVAHGTIGAADTPLLTRWGDYEIEAPLGRHVLVVVNEDKPGVVGAIGTILGRREINIGQVHLAAGPGNRALGIWKLDGILTEEALGEIKRAPRVEDAFALDLT
jgi:D-3-phosphoglycerate dehydrogenase